MADKYRLVGFPMNDAPFESRAGHSNSKANVDVNALCRLILGGNAGKNRRV